MIDVHIDSHYRLHCTDIHTLIGDLITFYNTYFHVDELDLEEGNEIEISWIYENVVLKK